MRDSSSTKLKRLSRFLFFYQCSAFAQEERKYNGVQGEIGFFDFYIIPLAKKLKDCGAFGVSSLEYLNYAQSNRDEWEAKGKGIVARMVKAVEEEL